MTRRVILSLGSKPGPPDQCYLGALGLDGLDLEVVCVRPADDPETVRALIRESGGLVLSGGPDVHPARYGEEPAGTEMRYVDETRDALEFAALAEADAAGLPVLAICRGAQVLNVQRGGGLIQDLGDAHRDGREQAEKWRPFHTVDVLPGTRTAKLLGATAETNSRHHQALDPAWLGTGLTLSGRCTDGTVEAVEESGPRFVLGVQWHPENMAIAADDSPERRQARALFAAFAQAAHQHRAD